MFATTLDCASAPGIRPATTLATFTIRSAIPPLFIIFPARIKNGIAISENELAPANNLCADVANEIFASSIHNIASADDNPTATLIDTPIASIITKSTTITIAV